MKKRLLLLLAVLFVGLQVWAQGTIRGRILDDRGEPVIGATVKVKGASKGTVTDLNGNFKLNVEDGTVLVISAIGMKATEKSATDGMSIKMATETRTTGEVVVTALAVQREKRSLGYATTQLKGDDVNVGQDRSALQALAGKVAGVNITNTSGSPGSGTRVVIRGGSSLTGNNQALIVVDGVPYDNSNAQVGASVDNLNNQLDLGNRGNDINPEDIESVTVLKGPAATALYGSRASNGAIMYTTKKGRGRSSTGKATHASFSTNYGWSNILMFPEFQNEWGQGYGGETHLEENWSWGRAFDGKLAPWGNVVNGTQKIKPYSALPDNVKDFYRRGKTWDNTFSLSGSSEKGSYYVSLYNLSNQGIVENSDYRRTGIRFNGTQNFTDKISATVGMNYNKVKSNLFAQGQANNSFYDQIFQTPRDIPMRELRDLKDPFNTLEGYYGAYTVNPYYILENYKNDNNVDRITGNLDLNWKPLKWLSVLNRTTNDLYFDNTTQYQPRYTVDRADFGVHLEEQGLYAVNNRVFQEINNDLMLTTTQNLSKDLSMTALLGHNVRENKLRSSYAETRGTVANDFYNLDNSADNANATNALRLQRWVGVYSRLEFNMKDMLFLDLSARNDWGSTLPTDKNSYFYPSAAMSFVFSELLHKEAKMSDKVLSFGKLRMSYARVGNDAQPYLLYPFQTKTTVTDGFNNSDLILPINNNAGFTVANTLENPVIQPEIMSAGEIGAELGFFDDRIRLDVSFYNNIGRQQIVNVNLPASSGYTAGVFNAGKIQNRGFELATTVTPIKTKSGLRWDIFATYTRNRSKVIEIFGDVTELSLGGFGGFDVMASEGREYGVFKTRAMQRDPQGRVIVGDDGMPLLTQDAQYFGSYNPKWFGGLGTDISYKGFKLHALFFHKHGGYFYSRLKNIMEFVGTSSTTAYNNREDFVVPNSVQETSPGVFVTNETKVGAEHFWTEQSNNEMNILPATFTKLRELSLSYSLPKKWLKQTMFGSADFGIYGNNLFLWVSKKKNEFGQRMNTFTDPEINGFGTGNVQGIEFGTVPSLRNYGVSLRFTF
jgi:TonB-linked SusC/RagA family outer membrane protein